MTVNSSTGGPATPTVCVTGAGGFIASWIVKLLLQKGYAVKGTVRNPDDPKNAHLLELEGARERLKLCKAHLLDFESLREAIDGCEGVFHTASPIAKDRNWYCYGKVLAEQAAWKMAGETGVDLVAVVPVVVLGPLLQPVVNASAKHILNFLNGSTTKYENAVQGYVHVKDVALGHILVYESPTASGRYLCVERMLHRGEISEILAKFFPQYPVPTKCSDEVRPRVKPYKFNDQKLRDLGFKYTSTEQGLYDTVKSLQDKGILPAPPQHARL